MIGVKKYPRILGDIFKSYMNKFQQFFYNSGWGHIFGHIIILTDFDIIKEAFNNRKISDRTRYENYNLYRQQARKSN